MINQINGKERVNWKDVRKDKNAYNISNCLSCEINLITEYYKNERHAYELGKIK